MAIALSVRVSPHRQHHTQTLAQQLVRWRTAVAPHPDWPLAEEPRYRAEGYRGANLHRPGLDRRRKARAEWERQPARRLEVSLAPLLGRDACARNHPEVTQTQHGVAPQLRHLDLPAHQQGAVAALAPGSETCCPPIRPPLDPWTVAQRRQLVTVLSDRVIVSDGQVAIRSVVPTGPKGKTVPFCHWRLDYFDLKAQAVVVPQLVIGELPVAASWRPL